MSSILNFDLLKNVLIISIGAGIITTSLVQRIKRFLSHSHHIPISNFLISMIIGTFFAFTFSNLSLIYCLWSGLFAFIGADSLYQTFEGKLFKSFNDLTQPKPTVQEEDADE